MKRILTLILCMAVFTLAFPTVHPVAANDVAAASGLSRGMEVTYDYPIFNDPMQMSDEEMFGVWNESGEYWEVTPKFAYSKWPAMHEVEEAAKAGDYAAAKDAALEYYRTNCSDRVLQRYTHPGAVSQEFSLALARNFYGVNFGSNMIRKMFEVDNTMAERRIDVTASITSAAGSETKRSFVLASVDQETTAEFVSKEGGYVSKLYLMVNGAPMEIEVDVDSYISAGSNASQCFGSEPVMLASEGITTQYINSTEETKRVLLTFDISNLSGSDNITNATLVVRGRNASGTGVKEMVLYQWADSSATEDKICWNSYAEHYMWSCNSMDCWDYVTSNTTLIKGKSCFFHRGNLLELLASMYNYTKDETYAYTFIRQQMGLVASIGYNPNVMNELDMSTHLDSATKAFFQVLESRYMDGERFAAIFKHLWMISRWICEDYYGTRNNNYATFATLGGYCFISHFREITDYDQWLLNTQNENERVQGSFLRPDDTCVELGRGYQATLLDTLYSPISRYNTTNNPDFPFTQYTIDNTLRLIHNFIHVSSPGYNGFDLGDSNDAGSTSTISLCKNFYNNLFTNDTLLEYVITDGASGTPPEKTSMSFPYGLRTFLRSDWGDKACSLAFTAKGETNSSHGDSDLLSVVMFAYGRYLLTDAAYGSVLTGGVYQYMGSAQQHNTVTVNGMDHVNDGNGHAGTEGREEEVELNDIYDFVTYSADDAITTAEQFRRSVAFMRDASFWIVSDYIRQDGTEYNDYSQHWQMLPSANIQIDPDTKIAYSNYEDVNVKVVPVTPEDYTYVQLEDTRYSPSTGSFLDNLKACYHQKTNAEEVVYTTLLVPENIGEDLHAEAYALDCGLPKTTACCTRIEITNRANNSSRTFYYYHLNDNSKQQSVTVGKYTTDATTLIMEEAPDGMFRSVMLLNATFLEADDVTDKVIFKSKEPLKAIAFKANGQTLDIEGSSLTADDVTDTTFYNYGRFQGVYVNGTQLKSSLKNGYLYFGDEPIIEGTPEQPDPSDPSGSSGSSSGGGGGHGGGMGGSTVVTPPVVIPGDNQPDDGNQDSLPEIIEEELSGHWGETELKELYQQGIITGDDEGLRLRDNISRGEFTVLLMRALELEPTEFQPIYGDVDAEDWYASAVTAASEAGLVSGSDGYFRPNDPITREELCKMLVAAYEQTGEVAETAEINFNDAEKINDWALPYVQKAVALELVNGMDDGSFAPLGSALREQAFVVIGRLLQKLD